MYNFFTDPPFGSIAKETYISMLYIGATMRVLDLIQGTSRINSEVKKSEIIRFEQFVFSNKFLVYSSFLSTRHKM